MAEDSVGSKRFELSLRVEGDVEVVVHGLVDSRSANGSAEVSLVEMAAAAEVVGPNSDVVKWSKIELVPVISSAKKPTTRNLHHRPQYLMRNQTDQWRESQFVDQLA